MLGAVFEHQLGLRAVFADDVMITKCERPYIMVSYSSKWRAADSTEPDPEVGDAFADRGPG